MSAPDANWTSQDDALGASHLRLGKHGVEGRQHAMNVRQHSDRSEHSPHLLARRVIVRIADSYTIN